jgi:hypothetical protein
MQDELGFPVTKRLIARCSDFIVKPRVPKGCPSGEPRRRCLATVGLIRTIMDTATVETCE